MVKCCRIADVTLDELWAVATEGGKTGDHIDAAIGQVVEDDKIMPSLLQLHADVRANVTSTTSDKDIHVFAE